MALGTAGLSGAQHPVAVDLDAVDVELLGELGGVDDVDLEEEDVGAVRGRVERALFAFLVARTRRGRRPGACWR